MSLCLQRYLYHLFEVTHFKYNRQLLGAKVTCCSIKPDVPFESLPTLVATVIQHKASGRDPEASWFHVALLLSFF